MFTEPFTNRAGATLLGLALSLGTGATAAEVVVVVSARSTVSQLSKFQAVDIFLGKVSRFPDGTPAVPIDQAEDSSARNDFYGRFAGKSPAQLNAHWSKIIFTGRGQPPREVANGVAVKKLLVQHPNAIGYIERSLLDDSVKVVLTQ